MIPYQKDRFQKWLYIKYLFDLVSTDRKKHKYYTIYICWQCVNNFKMNLYFITKTQFHIEAVTEIPLTKIQVL